MKEQKVSSPYESVLAVTVLFLLIYYFFYSEEVLIACAIIFIFLSLLIKKVAHFIDFVWNRLTKAIGWVMSRILMSIIFLIILTPIAFLYRLFGGKSFHLKENSSSFYVLRNHQFVSKDIEKPW